MLGIIGQSLRCATTIFRQYRGHLALSIIPRKRRRHFLTLCSLHGSHHQRVLQFANEVGRLSTDLGAVAVRQNLGEPVTITSSVAIIYSMVNAELSALGSQVGAGDPPENQAVSGVSSHLAGADDVYVAVRALGDLVAAVEDGLVAARALCLLSHKAVE
jgi:hypothetical protein